MCACSLLSLNALTIVVLMATSGLYEEGEHNLTKALERLLGKDEMLQPLGHDPTFQPASELWNYELIAKEGEYYNTSKVSYSLRTTTYMTKRATLL